MSNLPLALNHFPVAAKRATYAAQGDAASVTPLLPGTKQLEYREGEFFYRDIYVGLLYFVGQEIVYLSGKPIWSMSYAGGLLPGVEPTQARALYAFLRQALLQVPVELPLRGPASLEAGELQYTCQVQGGLERFHGTESIHHGNELRYVLHFSGGQIA